MDPTPLRASRTVRTIGGLLLILLPLALLELLAWAYLAVNRDNHPALLSFPLEGYIDSLDPVFLHAFQQGSGSYRPDDELGWAHRESSQQTHQNWTLSILGDGSRAPDPTHPVRIAVFGDSFTEGSEVDDQETWPRYLEAMLGMGVKNFGVSGYGPDQAALLATRQLDAGLDVDVLVLALTLENLNRLLTTFRPFYTWPQLDWGYGLKPRFVPLGKNFQLRHFTPDDWTSTASVALAIRAAARHDWYLPRRTLTVEAPFLFHAWPVLQEHGPVVVERPPWDTELAQRTLLHVVQTLDARSGAGQVVVIVLPGSPRDWAQPKPLPGLDAIVAKGIAVIDARSGLPQDGAYFRRVHYSPEGNRAVARSIAARLIAEVLPGLEASE